MRKDARGEGGRNATSGKVRRERNSPLSDFTQDRIDDAA